MAHAECCLRSGPTLPGSPLQVVGNWPACTEGPTALKSMARDDAGAKYVLFAAELKPKVRCARARVGGGVRVHACRRE